MDKLVTNSQIDEKDKKMQEDCEINKPFHIWVTGFMYDYKNIDQNPVRPFIIQH